MFVVLASAVGGVLIALRTRSRAVSETEPLPMRFPVVVVAVSAGSQGSCGIAFLDQLPEGPSHPEISYLVPDEDREQCQRAIGEAKQSVSPGEGPAMPVYSASATFSAVSREGFQEVEVYASWDDDWIQRSWYIAERHRIRPLRYQGFGAGVVLSSISHGVALSLVGTALAMIGWRRHHRAPKPPAHGGPDD